MNEATADPGIPTADAASAWQMWEAYQRTHDTRHVRGKAVGVDPRTGEVFFGETSTEIVNTLIGRGRRPLLVFWRVGSRYYGRLRGGRQCSRGV